MSAPALLDLFCGVGGWSKAFAARGWRCVGVDIANLGYPYELIQADVLTLERSFIDSFDAVVASPPCEEYARAWLPWLRMDRTPAPSTVHLLQWSVDLCDRPQRLVECSRFSTHHVKGALMFGSYALWGDVPTLMPELPRGKMAKSGMRPELRAEIPAELADWIAGLWSNPVPCINANALPPLPAPAYASAPSPCPSRPSRRSRRTRTRNATVACSYRSTGISFYGALYKFPVGLDIPPRRRALSLGFVSREPLCGPPFTDEEQVRPLRDFPAVLVRFEDYFGGIHLLCCFGCGVRCHLPQLRLAVFIDRLSSRLGAFGHCRKLRGVLGELCADLRWRALELTGDNGGVHARTMRKALGIVNNYFTAP